MSIILNPGAQKIQSVSGGILMRLILALQRRRREGRSRAEKRPQARRKVWNGPRPELQRAYFERMETQGPDGFYF